MKPTGRPPMGREKFDRLFEQRARARADLALAVEELEPGRFTVIDFYSRLTRGTFPNEPEAERHAHQLYGRTYETSFERDPKTGCYLPQPGWNAR